MRREKKGEVDVRGGETGWQEQKGGRGGSTGGGGGLRVRCYKSTCTRIERPYARPHANDGIMYCICIYTYNETDGKREGRRERGRKGGKEEERERGEREERERSRARE